MDAQQLFFEADQKWDAGEATAAFDLFLQAAALGHSGAALNVGYMYDVGEGVEKDLTKALLWYKRALKNKDLTACNNIALLYVELGQRRRALLWWRKAIAHGDNDAALELAKFLLKTGGRGATKQVIDLLKIAANSRRTEITPAGQEEAQRLLSTLDG